MASIEKSLETIVSDKVLKKAKKLMKDDKVINAKLSGDKLVGEIKGSKGDLHSCSITGDGEINCGCVGQRVHDTMCSHLTALMLAAGNEDFVRRVARTMYNDDVEPLFIPQDIFQTSLKGINQLLKGGIPLQSLFGIYGKFKAGKTILCQQLAWEVMAKYGMNSLLFDTESDYFKPDAVPIWASRFNRRFDIDVQLVKVTARPKWKGKKKPVIDKIKLEYYPSDYDRNKQTSFIFDEGKFEILIGLHGKPVSPHLKGGKIDLMPMDSGLYVFYISQSLIGDFVENHNIKFVSYDSITRPFAAYHGGRLNYPVRNEAENLFFSQIDEVLKTYNLVSVCTHRETSNPTNRYDRPGPKGGRAVGHWFKRMIHLRKVGKSVKRRLKVYRVPSEAEWDESSWKSDRHIYLSNVGFKDYEE